MWDFKENGKLVKKNMNLQGKKFQKKKITKCPPQIDHISAYLQFILFLTHRNIVLLLHQDVSLKHSKSSYYKPRIGLSNSFFL